jgi:uncharacterized membrane protein YkgB
MPPLSIPTVLQLVVGLGLLNVWLIRANASTAYRGGTAQSLKEEFAEYGLPEWMFLLVGALKIVAGIALIVGLWMPRLVLPAAGVVVVLMVGALTMHVKVRDPWIKSLPAFLMLLMSAGILLLR